MSNATHSEKTSAIAVRFKNISQKPHLPADMLAIVGKVLELEAEALPKVKIELDASTKSKLAPLEARLQGAPLLLREDFPIDRALGVEVAEKLLASLPDLVKDLDPGLSESALELQKALAAKELNWDDAFTALLKEDVEFFNKWAERLPKAPALVRFLALSGAAPSIRVIEEILNGLLSPLAGHHESVWAHGHCPACGSLPFFGRLAEKEGKRYHSCSFCRHEYRVKRLQCPFCLNDDNEKLLYYTSEEEPMYQLHVCKECKNYLKLSDYRQAAIDYVPALDDLDSLTIDILARRMGYTRPTLSAWGF